MKLYLIRHGQTVDHENGLKQNSESLLSEEGRKQAKRVASLLAEKEIDLVLASKMARARETAEVLAKELDKPLEFVDGIQEKRYSKELEGISRESELYKQYLEEVRNNWENMDWRFWETDETLREVGVRATAFKDLLLANYKDKNVAVVSHGIFLRCFIPVCLLPELNDEDFMNLFDWISFKHTGMCVLDYEEELGRWRTVF